MIDQGLANVVYVYVTVLSVLGIATLLGVAAWTAHGPVTAWAQRRRDTRQPRRAVDGHDRRDTEVAAGRSGSFTGHGTAAAH